MQHSPPRRGGVDATLIKMARSFLCRSGRGGQTGENSTIHSAELTIASARNKVASRLLIDRAATPPLRGGECFSFIGIHMKTIRAVCPHDCPDACAMLVEVDEAGRATRVRGDPEHPYTHGGLCVK